MVSVLHRNEPYFCLIHGEYTRTGKNGKVQKQR
nr:MAG TPA: hypothetical protein [Bacteriophage sp.]